MATQTNINNNNCATISVWDPTVGAQYDASSQTWTLRYQNGASCIIGSTPVPRTLVLNLLCSQTGTNKLTSVINPVATCEYDYYATGPAFCATSTIQTCQDYPLNTYPYCNSSLPINIRVNDLISRLTLQEKVTLSQSDQGGVPRLGLPTLGHTECTHGTFISKTGLNSNASYQDFPTTLFPQASIMAQSFDRDMLYKVSRAVADEVRAKHSQAIAQGWQPNNGFGLVCWAPVVNICRDPRWGRCQEGYGEDPLLSAELARKYVNGLQIDPDYSGEDNNGYYEVISTCKHFDAHNGPEKNKGSFDAILSYRDWIDSFQPAFKACAEAGVRSYMCSYNAINGVPNCANGELLNGLAREQWGWDGFVVSDCGAIGDIYSAHHYANNYIEAAQMAIKGGCDWLGSCSFPQDDVYWLLYGIQNGTLPEHYLDTALQRVLPAWFQLGLLDVQSNIKWNNYNLLDLYNEHTSLAYEMSLQSMVLLENRNHILPFNVYNVNKTVWAIVGPCANNSICYEGDYNAEPLIIKSPYMGFFNLDDITLLYAPGCVDTACSVLDPNMVQSVMDAVSKADFVVYVGGISTQQETEGLDRDYIELPYNQSILFRKMYDIISSRLDQNDSVKLISVLCYGTPVIDTTLFQKSDAVIGAGYGGERIGDALFDIMFGEYAPSGRTSITWYASTEQLSNITNYNMTQYPGRTYRYLKQEPYYSFGYGLSYSSFSYNDLSLSDHTINPCDDIIVTFKVKNKGPIFAADEVCQVYLKVILENSDIVTDQLRLVNFTKLYDMQVNETQTVSLLISYEQMKVTKGYNYQQVIEPGTYQVFVGGYLTMNHIDSQTGEFYYPTLLNTTFVIDGNTTKVNQCSQTDEFEFEKVYVSEVKSYN